MTHGDFIDDYIDIIVYVVIYLALLGVIAVIAAGITYAFGYTWIAMPPGGGCWS